MQMNPATRPEVLREADQAREPCGMPTGDAVPQELCSNVQTPPWNPPGPNVPDEGAFESLVGGAGI